MLRASCCSGQSLAAASAIARVSAAANEACGSWLVARAGSGCWRKQEGGGGKGEDKRERMGQQMPNLLLLLLLLLLSEQTR